MDQEDRVVLDTSVLISHWIRFRKRSLKEYTARDAEDWGTKVIAFEKSRAIVTPVFLEMVGGTRDRHELDLTRAFLGCFRIIDDGKIIPEDWREAKRLAQRVPRDGSPRQMGDCLIRAIANRLKHNVRTLDANFPS